MTGSESSHPAAGAEYLDALRYFEAIDSRVADEFATAIGNAIRDIHWSPEAWPRFPGWDRLPIVRSHKVDVF